MLGQYFEPEDVYFDQPVYDSVSYDWYSDLSTAGYSYDTPITGDGDSGFFDIFKSLISVAAPVALSVLKSEGQEPQTLIKYVQTPVQQQAATQPSIAASLGGMLSNPLVLVAAGIGAFLLLRGRKK